MREFALRPMALRSCFVLRPNILQVVSFGPDIRYDTSL